MSALSDIIADFPDALSAFSNTEIAVALFSAWLAYRGIRFLTTPNPLDLIPGPKPDSWVSGNIDKVVDPDSSDYHIYLETFGPVALIKSFFGANMVNVYDPKALYQILVKEQDIFDENPIFRATFNVAFGPGLLSTLGDTHRRQRKLLNPAFSGKHIRELVPVFYSVTNKLRDTLRRKIERGDTEIDVLEWANRTALEIIGQSGLGHSFDELTEDAKEHPFGLAVRGFAQAINTFTISRFIILPLFQNFGPARFRRFIVDMLPWPRLHRLRDMVDVIDQTTVRVFEEKKRAIERGEPPIEGNPWDGKDIISLLLKANMSASEAERLPDHELLAQLATITFAAMDTTSNTISRILHLLATRKDVQKRLRDEIVKARSEGGDLQHDELDQLPFLDAVCKESLRLYPVAPIMVRQSNKTTVLHLHRPIAMTNGLKSDQLVIPAGTDILLGILACNRDTELWGPDAAEWIPDRWLKPLPKNVLDAPIPGVYSHLMSFIGGKKACLGFKFAVLEMKVVLSVLLETFEFSLSDSAPEIKWQTNGVVQPAVAQLGAPAGTPPRIGLPMKITLVQ